MTTSKRFCCLSRYVGGWVLVNNLIFFVQARNYNEEAAQRSVPVKRCELAGVSVCLYQGDAVADMAKLLPRLDYGGSPHFFSPKYIIIYFYNHVNKKNVAM